LEQGGAIGAALPAEQAPGLHAVPVGALACRDLRVDRAQGAAEAESTAMRPGAPGILHEAEILDPPGKAGLEDLGRVEAAVAVDANDGIVAVRLSTAAPAARHQVVAGVVFLVVGMV